MEGAGDSKIDSVTPERRALIAAFRLGYIVACANSEETANDQCRLLSESVLDALERDLIRGAK